MSDTVEADLVLVNARLWSPGHAKPWNGAIALGGGKIVRVGSNEKCEADAATDAGILDMDRRLVLPSFIDAHAHLLHTGPRMNWVQLDKIQSLRGLLAVIGRESKKSGWVLGRSWDESKWPERRFPTRRELDELAGRRPVFLRRVDGHMAVVNTASLKLLKIPRDTKGFDKDSRGVPTGVIREKALEIAGERLRPTVGELVDCFPRMRQMAYRHGITSFHDVVDSRGMQAYRMLHREGRLGLRVSMMPLFKPLSRLMRQRRNGDEWLRIGGLKGFADGSFGSRTAALYEPYQDDKKEYGMLIHRIDSLKRMVKDAHRQGFQLAIHAIGDKAIDEVVDAYELALDERPMENHRHRIEHFELPTEGALDRCRNLGVLPVMQPNFVMEWGLPGGMYDARLGAKRAKKSNPHRLILAKGLRFAFGSDGMPYGPIYGLQGAVCPPHPDQKISLDGALEAYTLGGAFASFEENVKGALVPGMFADLAVVEGSWSGVGLRHWKVAATIIDGRVVFKIPAIGRA